MNKSRVDSFSCTKGPCLVGAISGGGIARGAVSGAGKQHTRNGRWLVGGVGRKSINPPSKAGKPRKSVCARPSRYHGTWHEASRASIKSSRDENCDTSSTRGNHSDVAGALLAPRPATSGSQRGNMATAKCNRPDARRCPSIGMSSFNNL
jgi:hypothetical protein